MINLLPPEQRRQVRAARTNTLLIRYNFIMVGAIVFLFLASGFVYVYLNGTKASAEQTISDNQSKVSGYASVKNEADQFRANLSVAKQILNHEVTYTSVILQIAHLLPSGVVLDGLNLDSQTFGTPTTLTAKAKTYQDALNLKSSFQKSALFSDVHLISIASGADNSNDASYPVTVTISVTISKDTVK